MSIPGAGNPLLLGGAGGYKIERSLRFNSADSAYLSRTPASAGNRKTWTWAGWVKLSKNTGLVTLLDAFPTSSTASNIIFDGGSLRYADYNNAYTSLVASSAVFRDFSAWYHIVCAYDSPQNTASNRVKLYVNGSQITQFSSASYPSQNYDSFINTTSGHSIGGRVGGMYLLDGYLADIHFIDGQALTPSSFGETDINGVWQPKAYSGSYGTNGFKLAFADNSAATATTLGKDTSGNGNNWTPNNLSVTAGAGNDSLVDSPTNYGTDTGAGGEVRGNYCTWNPISGSTGVVSNGNLDTSNANTYRVYGTFGLASGKWYWEHTIASIGSGVVIGISSNVSQAASDSNRQGYYSADGRFYNNSGDSAYGNTYTTGDVIGVAYDADTGKLYFSKNGTWQNSGNPATGSNPAVSGLTGTFWPFATLVSCTLNSNFGQRQWAYTAPAGFKALCTQNLPAPTITKPSTVMDVKLYTGNGGTQTISGLGFSPDLVWIKNRQDNLSWNLFNDTVRGANKILASNETGAEYSNDTNGYLSAFTSDGFTLTNGGNGIQVNGSGKSFVSWAWDAGSSTVTNTSGTISSQVRANASAGFSVVTAGYFSGTVGHGLGVAPAMVIAKQRDIANSWYVYHQNAIAAGTVANNSFLLLHATSVVGNNGANLWNVTSTTVGTNQGLTGSAVYYCFAPVASYSAFGSYTGNGSADGPIVFTNMRPRWIMLKRTDSTSNWTIIDTAREGYNVDNDPLYPNLSDAEGTTDLADILSNGFKLRSTDTSVNANAGTYVYACFAESPFALARAR